MDVRADNVPAARHRSDGGELIGDPGYGELLSEIKRRIAEARTRAASAVNTELIRLYWSIGHDILARQDQEGWGAKVIEQLARDLKDEGHKGFSAGNLNYMRAFAAAWPGTENPPQPVEKLPWGHVRLLLDKLSDPDTRLWYAHQACEQGWSRNVLQHQIASTLHARQGRALTNFDRTLPSPDSELAQELIKDPYDLGFVPGERVAVERDLERALLAEVEKFMLELGTGFMFAGRQRRLDVGGDEFFLDLLFYQHRLRRFVVIDLKIGKFKAEDGGKMNLYLNAVDDQLRHEDDRESIGIVLCTNRNRQVVEYALRGMETPIGVSTFRLGDTELTEELPPEFERELPSVPQLTAGLQRIVDERAEEIEAALEASDE